MSTNVNEFAASTLPASRPDRGRQPGQGQHEEQDHGRRRRPAGRARGGPPADRQAHADDQGGGDEVAGQAGRDVADQDQGAADRHGPEPVHDAVAHVGGHRDRGGARAEPGAQHDQAGHHVVDVGAAAVEGAAEHVHEHQHQHHGQHQRGEERLRVTQRTADAAGDHHPRVGERVGHAHRAISFGSASGRAGRGAGNGQEHVVQAGAVGGHLVRGGARVLRGGPGSGRSRWPCPRWPRRWCAAGASVRTGSRPPSARS